MKHNPKELYITGFTQNFGGNNRFINKDKTQLNYDSYMESIKSVGYYKCHDAYKLFLYSRKILLNNDIIKLDKEYFDILNLPISNKDDLILLTGCCLWYQLSNCKSYCSGFLTRNY